MRPPPPPLPPMVWSMMSICDIEYDEPTPPPLVLWSGFGGLIERFGLNLYKLIVLIKGFHAVTPPPPPPSRGPAVGTWWFN